jgi:PGAP1-like protein
MKRLAWGWHQRNAIVAAWLFATNSIDFSKCGVVSFSALPLTPPFRRASPFKLSASAVPSSSAAAAAAAPQKVAVLVCPAQFCVPADYEGLMERLTPHMASDRILVDCRVAPLPRTEWIKVARQLPTAAFVQGQLPVPETLEWYFTAIEQALSDLWATHGPDTNVCLVGHSMGGWVARAYLGGLATTSTAIARHAPTRISSLITLGTPHSCPSTALVDQTRGLLAAICAAPSCTPQALMEPQQEASSSTLVRDTKPENRLEITCVGSDTVTSRIVTTNIEELVATASYLPLTGQIQDVVGDGIVPLDLAFLEPPARRVVLTKCALTNYPIRHAHVIPTPWNLWNGAAPSIGLDAETIPSYVSPGVVPQWASYIR